MQDGNEIEAIRFQVDRLESVSGGDEVPTLANALDGIVDVLESTSATERERQIAINLRSAAVRFVRKRALTLQGHGNPTNEQYVTLADLVLAVAQQRAALQLSDRLQWRKAGEATAYLGIAMGFSNQ